MKQENDPTTSILVSDRPDVTGKSTISEARNKNVSSLSGASQLESLRRLPQTRKEIAAVAAAAAMK